MGNTILDAIYPPEKKPEEAPKELVEQTPPPLPALKLKSAFSRSSATPSNQTLASSTDASFAALKPALDESAFVNRKEIEHLAFVEPAIEEMRVYLIKEPNRLLV